MSLSQPTATGSIGTPTPKLKLDQSSGVTLNSSAFTAMVWAYHTGGVSDAYQDIISIRDSTIGGGASDDQVVGLGTHVPGSVRVLNLGDVDTDLDGTQTIPDNEWHHFTLIGEKVPDSGGQRVRLTAYFDGVQHLRSDDTSMTPPIFPDSDCFIQFFNSRSSDTDAGSVFVGYMAAIKIWNDVVLKPWEVQREMWSYLPVRRRDAWAVLPLIDKASAGFNYLGADFTVQGANFAAGALDPPGVSWDDPMARRDPSLWYAPPSCALTGTLTSSATEADVVAGGKTLILTLSNDLWMP